MISFERTRVVISNDRPVASGSTIAAEGLALVADYTGGQFGVKASGAGVAQMFAGFSIGQRITPTYLPFCEEVVIADLGGSVFGALLTKTPANPSASTVRATIGGTEGVYDTTPDATLDFWVDGQYVKGFSTDEGLTLKIWYRYAVTVADILALQGNMPAGGITAGEVLDMIGVIEQGDIFTSEFNQARDWAAATSIKVCANGQLDTEAGTGTVINAYVIHLPTAGDGETPFLGIRFSA